MGIGNLTFSGYQKVLGGAYKSSVYIQYIDFSHLDGEQGVGGKHTSCTNNRALGSFFIAHWKNQRLIYLGDLSKQDFPSDNDNP